MDRTSSNPIFIWVKSYPFLFLIARLGCTLQFSNSGITPGAGVHNARKELCAATLGVPVVSIGIPTVVDLALEEVLRTGELAGDAIGQYLAGKIVG